MHDRSRDLRGDLRRLECEHGGRLGVAILDTANTESIAYRGDERFAMCSTFKFLAAAFVLARVDRKRESLTRRVIFGEDCLEDRREKKERLGNRSDKTKKRKPKGGG